MDKIIELLQKAERLLEQGAIGKARLVKNVQFARRILVAARAEDLGEETNKVADELIVLADKVLLLAGPTASDESAS
jgi:hypothetical protein